MFLFLSNTILILSNTIISVTVIILKLINNNNNIHTYSSICTKFCILLIHGVNSKGL